MSNLIKNAAGDIKDQVVGGTEEIVEHLIKEDLPQAVDAIGDRADLTLAAIDARLQQFAKGLRENWESAIPKIARDTLAANLDLLTGYRFTVGLEGGKLAFGVEKLA